uniref:Uncharacterized protein n=1 Tax=Hyaloperonospora arabidopsidis (strain Emoy2) TaxID=559515 RepID=M4BFF7_HYAAE
MSSCLALASYECERDRSDLRDECSDSSDELNISRRNSRLPRGTAFVASALAALWLGFAGEFELEGESDSPE